MSMASTILMTPRAGLFQAFPGIKEFNSTSLRPSLKALSLSLSSRWRRGGYFPLVLGSPSPVQTPRQGFEPVTTVAGKGYKMKTHKASAKRFRVTGNGKIVRRRAGKQHLLTKKNTKRKNRLSKMVCAISLSLQKQIVKCQCAQNFLVLNVCILHILCISLDS